MEDADMKDWLSALRATEHAEYNPQVEPDFNFFRGTYYPEAPNAYDDDLSFPSGGGQQDSDNHPDNSDDSDDSAHRCQDNTSSSSADTLTEEDFYNESHDRVLRKRARYSTQLTSLENGSHPSPHPRNRRTPACDLPDWFIDRPFQHNVKIGVIGLPGALIAASLGGEFLLGIVCLAVLLIYLFHSAEQPDKALTVYTVAYVTVAIVVFYSTLPLLWKSGFNVILLMALMCYTVLTGSWILLGFAEFRKREPHLCHLLEFLLFVFYPVIAVVLVTWFVVNLYSAAIGPYVVMALGYPVLQNILQPTYASFHQSKWGNRESDLVIPTVYSSIIVVTFSVYPWFVFTMIALVKGGLFTMLGCTEFLFLFSSNAFMTTAFDISPLLLQHNVPDKHQTYAQILSAVISMVTLPLVLHLHGFQSVLLLWLPLLLSLHAAFGYFLSNQQHKNETASFVLGGLLLALYSALFYRVLPWTMNHYILGEIHMNMVFILVYMNVVLSLLCLLAYNLFDSDELGLSVILHSVLLVATQKVLECGGLIHPTALGCISTVAVYIYVKLCHWKKVGATHAEVCVCLHMAALATMLLNSVKRDQDKENNLVADTTAFVILSAFIGLINRHVVFYNDQEHSERISVKEYGWKLLFAVLVTVTALYSWYPKVIVLTGLNQFNLANYLGCVFSVLSLITWREAPDVSWKGVKHLAKALLILAVIVVFIQPGLDTTWENMVRWLILLTITQAGFLPEVLTHLRKKSNTFLIIPLSVCSGFPLGLVISSDVIFGGVGVGVDISEAVITGVICTILAGIAICVWVESSHMDRQVYGGVGAIITVLSLTLVFFPSSWQHQQESSDSHTPLFILKLVLLSCTAMSIILKLNSLRKHSIMQLTPDGSDLQISKLPIMGNLMTVSATITGFAFCPPWWPIEAWLPTCLSGLILLQEDFVMLGADKFRRNYSNVTPTLITATAALFAFSWYNCNLWTKQVLWLPWVNAVLELSLLSLTLPVLGVFWTVLWCERFYVSDYYVLFATPLYALVLLTGSGWAARVLGVVGGGIGWWLITEKLPLRR